MEEYSYRYSRLKSYSQYLLFDDPRALGLLGAQVGRLPDRAAGSRTAKAKPSFEAYKLPIVVKKRGGGVLDLGPRAPGHRHPLRAAAAEAAEAAS